MVAQRSRATGWAGWHRRLGLYALAQPLVSGRRVVELWNAALPGADDGEGGDGEGTELHQLGAAEVVSLQPEASPLALADGACDVVLCPNYVPGETEDERARWLSEIVRVLSPTGVCVLRVPLDDVAAHELAHEDAAAEFGDADEPAPIAEGGAEHAVEGAGDGEMVDAGDELAPAAPALDEPTAAVVDPRWEHWRRLIPESFPGVQIVEELAFAGISFRVAGTDDLAIVGDLSPLAAPADFEVVLCAKDAAALPPFAESLLVPLGGLLEALADDGAAAAELPEAELGEGEFADELAEVTEADAPHGELAADLERLSADLAAAMAAREVAERERDEARLAAASVRDRDGSRDATITSLRAAVERQLQRLADVEVTLGRVGTERDEALRRAEAAEEALHDAEAALRRREWEATSLARDLDRFGRPAGPKG